VALLEAEGLVLLVRVEVGGGDLQAQVVKELVVLAAVAVDRAVEILVFVAMALVVLPLVLVPVIVHLLLTLVLLAC
jgi:hypothetical protein